MENAVQKHIRCREGDVAEYVLIPGDPARAERIAKRLDNAHLVASNREYAVYTGSYEGVPVSVCSTGIGGPSTAIAMEEPVIVNAAVRAGGTGSAYLPDIYPAVASLDVVNAMIEASRELDLKAHVGVSLSRDAFYRQNPQLNETLRDVQAVAVSEMECDTVFVVGAALNVRTGAVVGTDSNIYLSVQPTQAEKEALYMKSEERTIAIALKACVLLAE